MLKLLNGKRIEQNFKGIMSQTEGVKSDTRGIKKQSLMSKVVLSNTNENKSKVKGILFSHTFPKRGCIVESDFLMTLFHESYLEKKYEN